MRPPPPLKRSVVELSGKDQQIALAEYSRLVVLFLVLGDPGHKGQIFGKSMIFQLYESISATLYRNGTFTSFPRSNLHRMSSWLYIYIVLIDDVVSHRFTGQIYDHGSVT